MSTPHDLDSGATILAFTPGARLFDRYVLQRLLGSGRKGDVWLARDDKLGMDVAVKLLKNYPHFHELRSQIGRLMDLSHQSIIRVIDLAGDEKLAGFVMEYFESRNLATLLAEKNGRPFETTEIQRWMRDLYAALEFASSRSGLVHKDLRLANLLVSPAGQLKVAEFGLVPERPAGSEAAPTDTEYVSLPALSPQVLAGETPTPQDDLYSAAACVYELLTGKPVFPGGNIVLQIQKKVPPKIAERRAELGLKGDAVPKAWEQWIAQSLEKEREKRPASASAIVEALQSGTSLDTRRTTSAANVLASTVSKAIDGIREQDHSWMGSLLKAAAVLGLLGGAFWYFWVLPAREKSAELRTAFSTLREQDAEIEDKGGDAAQADKMQKAWQKFIRAHQFDDIAFTDEERVVLTQANDRLAFWKEREEELEKEAQRLRQVHRDLVARLESEVKREQDADKEADSPTATSISRAAAIPGRVEAWQHLIDKYNKDDASAAEDYQAPLLIARRSLATWQARQKATEEASKKWITESELAFSGLGAFLKLGDKGAQAKLNRLTTFIEGLRKNPPPGTAAKTQEYTAAISQMQAEWGRKLDQERATPPAKTLGEFFAGTPLADADENSQKAALKLLQSELKNDGCFTQEPNGVLGDATVTAFKDWQTKKDLPADGRISSASWAATDLGKMDPGTLTTQLTDLAKKAGEEAKKAVATTTKKYTGSGKGKPASKEEPGKVKQAVTAVGGALKNGFNGVKNFVTGGDSKKSSSKKKK
ncbi:protein kinase domain-containing protein [Prosthecobacter sp.]|uniref:protein kinase domain-containing protein n=1 Tax=Prosthecobacter sp. TaxID=1965333 RepID=UPI0037832697